MRHLRTTLGRLLPPRLRRAAITAEISILARLHGRAVGALLAPWFLRRFVRRPEEVDIEVTSSCDADCIMCPRRQMRRAQGPMPLPLFRAIVDEAIELGVRDLVLNGYGEIATLRNYREYLSYIRRRSTNIRILVNTNGMRLTEDLASALIEHRVDVVNIAIDGATAPTFEGIRKHLKLDVIETNVHRLIAMRNQAGRLPYVMVHMIYMPENAHEMDAFLAKWTGVADETGLAGFSTRGGSLPAQRRQADWTATPCFLLWRQMPILSDGTIAMCCDDWDGVMSLGNVADGGIRSAWSSHVHRQLRRLHLERRAGEIALCAGCQAPRRPPWWFHRRAVRP